MTKPFQPNPEWRYTWEDLADASTAEELHRASYGRLLHRFLLSPLCQMGGLAFIHFGGDPIAAESYRAALVSDPRWSRLRLEMIEIRSLQDGEALYSVALGPIEPVAWFQLPDDPEGGASKSHFPTSDLFTDEGMAAVQEDLGGILVEPLDATGSEVGLEILAEYGVAGVPGIRAGRPARKVT